MDELVDNFTEYGFQMKEECLFVVFIEHLLCSPLSLSGARARVLSFLGKFIALI